jgi:hypothetical protein
MPRLLVPTDSPVRRMDAVTAIFGARSRDGALDTPRVPTTARPRCVVAFIGANHAIAQAIRPAVRPAIAVKQRPPEPRVAQSTSPVRPLDRNSPGSPARALAHQ